ncbi:MAG: hypothetical protein JWM57_1868, partial [Phycisphaerales bacterium]|nr:hypothetical protein [Phycisphaerales bacterium]
MAGDYSDFLISLVIRKAGNEWAFEKFCCRQMRSIDGFDYLPTSRSYDLGADGRSRTLRGNGESYIVSTKQEERLPQKAVRDLKRLLQRDRHPAMVIFYFTEVTSETLRLEIEKEVFKLLKSPFKFKVFGREQIIEQVHQRSAAFEETYLNAIEEIRRMTAPANRRSVADIRLGYQILLSAQMDKAGSDLRREIVRSFVLEALEELPNQTQGEIANRITESLQLLSPIDPIYVSPVIKDLLREGMIAEGTRG